MKKILVVLSLVAVLALYRCTPAIKDRTTVNFPYTFNCSDKICLPINAFSPKDIIVADSLIIFIQKHEKNVIRIYDRQNYKLIGSFLSIGRGPNEIMLVPKIRQWKIVEDTVMLFVRSYPKSWMWININESLDSGKVIVGKEYNFLADRKKRDISRSAGLTFDIGGDSLIMMINPHQKDKLQRNPNPYFIYYDYNKSIYKDSLFVQNFALVEGMQPMLFSGPSSISDDHRMLVHAYFYMNCIDFFDLKTFSKKTIFFSPDAKDYKKIIEKPTYRFKETCGTKDYVYVLKDQANKGDSLIGSSICVFSWDAQPVCELRFDERINYFFVEDKSHELFAIDYDEKIWRYKMPINTTKANKSSIENGIHEH